jgi:hypothetical protein
MRVHPALVVAFAALTFGAVGAGVDRLAAQEEIQEPCLEVYDLDGVLTGYATPEGAVPSDCVAPTAPTTTSPCDDPELGCSASTTTVPVTTTTVPETTTSTTSTTSTTVPVTTTTTSPPTTTVPPSGEFLATFDTPAEFYDVFERDVHFRADDYDEAATFHGDHNDACEGPTTGRTVHLDGVDNDEVFWHCAPGGPTTGHVMVAMGEAGFGYAIVTIKPTRSFSDVTEICVDVNATELGGDKWWEMSVLPKSVFDANGGRMDYITAIARDIDQTALSFPAEAFVYQINDSKIRAYQGMSELVFDWYRWSTPDRAQRFTYCMVDNGDGFVTLSREVGEDSSSSPGGVRTVTVPGEFPDGEVVVFWQDSTYDPPKHGSGPDQTTWHLDNFLVRSG